MAKQRTKLLQAHIPTHLYNRFRSSKFRRNANTDGEAIRAMLVYILNLGKESQHKNDSALRT